MSSLLQQLNFQLSDVVAEVRRSVVQVLNGRGGAGAGTIWHADGLILTNAHVVRGSGGMRGLQVALQDGRVLNAQVIARDDERDLAALAIEANGLPTIQVGSARKLQAGQWVFAVGHPWGVANAATGGVVISTGRSISELPKAEWVVVDLKLRPGNSGGPLVDVAGRMVGVNTIMTGILGGAAVSVESTKDFLKRNIGDGAAADPVPPQAKPELV